MGRGQEGADVICSLLQLYLCLAALVGAGAGVTASKVVRPSDDSQSAHANILGRSTALINVTSLQHWLVACWLLDMMDMHTCMMRLWLA